MITKGKKPVTIIGGIFDKKLEKEFFESEISSFKKHIQIILLIISIAYIAYGTLNNVLDGKAILNITTYMRIAILLCSISLIIVIEKSKNYNGLKKWFTFYEVIFCVVYLVSTYLNGFSDYFIHCFEVIVIMIGIFLLPNKWINSLIVSLMFAISYFIFSYAVIGDIEVMHFLATISYVTINILFIGVLTFRISSYKRVQYLTEKKFSQVSIIDQLSEISNRFKFDEEYRRLFNYYKNHKGNLAIVMFEIDHFKKINLELGQSVGDKVLREITKMVKVFIRGNDVFARWGEEEFVILLSGVDTRIALNVTKRIKEGIWDHYFSNVGTITCCFGVASPQEGESMEDLLVRVNKYLKRAKKEGGNEIIFN
ncbi:hypothetical protein SH2C18_23430 [Clostridium sediminicola]|uniref:GGDEF domain-containing protein n=1 Tax=Clostridium sediminicola TaxID=3114879 RepID=UPI0031F209DE